MTIHEKLLDIATGATRPLKVALMKKHNSLALRNVLKAAFDDTVILDLPKGAPAYETGLSKDGNNPSSLERLSADLAYFVRGRGPGKDLIKAKKEKMFVDLLCSIDKEDAELLIAVKDKKLQARYPGITATVVREAFPKLLESKPPEPLQK